MGCTAATWMTAYFKFSLLVSVVRTCCIVWIQVFQLDLNMQRWKTRHLWIRLNFPRPRNIFCVPFGIKHSLLFLCPSVMSEKSIPAWYGGIKKWPLLPAASVVTAWHCQIAVRTCNPRGMNDSNIKNGRVGLNTSPCFIGVCTGTCVYLPNTWIRISIHSTHLHKHNLLSAEWCHLKWTWSWPNGV